MTTFHGKVYLGIRDKETEKLVAIYPESIDADSVNAEKKVLDWYYKQDCHTSENIENVYVDYLSEREFKEIR